MQSIAAKETSHGTASSVEYLSSPATSLPLSMKTPFTPHLKTSHAFHRVSFKISESLQSSFDRKTTEIYLENVQGFLLKFSLLASPVSSLRYEVWVNFWTNGLINVSERKIMKPTRVSRGTSFPFHENFNIR